ncbi:25753_t:CDS:1, partial [Racocetra persica]
QIHQHWESRLRLRMLNGHKAGLSGTSSGLVRNSSRDLIRHLIINVNVKNIDDQQEIAATGFGL